MKISLIRHLWKLFCAYVIGIYASLLNCLHISGYENLPEEKTGILLLANHISSFDTVFIPWAILKKFPFRMVWAPAKKELFANPFVGWLLSSWGAFPVARGRDTKASGHINELLKTEIVMLFPEGTRNKNAILAEGNRGVGKIILETRPVVIPVALINLNKWSFPKLLQKGKIVFGKPIDMTELLQKEMTKDTYRIITDKVMIEIAALLEQNRN